MLPLLETTRLRLRHPRSTDIENIYALGRNPNVMRYISKGKPQTRKEAEADLDRRIRISEEQGDKGQGFWFAEEKATGEFVGWFVLNNLDKSEEIEIGYRLLEEKWNKGYATEGSQRLLKYAFQKLKLPEVVAVALEENIGSTMVMKKIGMQYIKAAPFYGFDCVYYRITDKEWLNQQ